MNEVLHFIVKLLDNLCIIVMSQQLMFWEVNKSTIYVKCVCNIKKVKTKVDSKKYFRTMPI